MTPAPQLLHSPAVLLQKAVPYKRLLAVLVRSSCVSLAISNEQLNMAEPLGAVLLRDGRVPERGVARLLPPATASTITGCVLGHDSLTTYAAASGDPQAQRVLQQLQGLISKLVSPDLPAAWWDQWSPLCELSSRQAVAAAGGGAMAGRQQVAGAAGPAGGLVASVASSEQSQGGKMQPAAQGGAAGGAGGLSSGFAASGLVNDIGGARCSMGTAFLQHFLDKLGCDSTFG